MDSTMMLAATGFVALSAVSLVAARRAVRYAPIIRCYGDEIVDDARQMPGPVCEAIARAGAGTARWSAPLRVLLRQWELARAMRQPRVLSAVWGAMNPATAEINARFKQYRQQLRRNMLRANPIAGALLLLVYRYGTVRRRLAIDAAMLWPHGIGILQTKSMMRVVAEAHESKLSSLAAGNDDLPAKRPALRLVWSAEDAPPRLGLDRPEFDGPYAS